MRPNVKIQNPELYVLIEEPCVIEAVIGGNPTPDVKWFKDDKLIDNDDNANYEFVDTICKLTIPRALPESSGLYKCVVENAVGKSEAKAQIVTQGECSLLSKIATTHEP